MTITLSPPTLLHSATLPITLSNSNYGQSKHWSESFAERHNIYVILLSKFKREPFIERVDIVVTRILAKGDHLWDADSIGRGNAKQLIDSLVALGWFRDDGPKWIRNCDYRQDDSQREKFGRVRVEVFEIEEEW